MSGRSHLRVVRFICLIFAGYPMYAGGLPDLRPRIDSVDLDGDSKIFPEITRVRINYTLFNDGTENAPSTTTGVYLSTDSTLSPDDILVYTTFAFSVSANSSLGLAASFMLPPVPSGLYALIIVADQPEEVNESDETNNTDFAGATVGGSGSGVVNVDFDFEYPTFENQGVYLDPGNNFWNGRVTGFGFWTIANLTQSDGITPSNLRFAFETTSRARVGGSNVLLADWSGGTTTTGEEMRFSSLIPNETYDLYLYAVGTGPGMIGAAFTFDGVTKETSGGNFSTFVEGENYVVFRGLQTDSIGVITGQIAGSSLATTTDKYALNGFQLVRVGNRTLVGDVNCDGFVSVGDIAGFVLAVTDAAGYADNFPDCDIQSADINDDGMISVGDIGGFVALLTM